MAGYSIIFNQKIYEHMRKMTELIFFKENKS